MNPTHIKPKVDYTVCMWLGLWLLGILAEINKMVIFLITIYGKHIL